MLKKHGVCQNRKRRPFRLTNIIANKDLSHTCRLRLDSSPCGNDTTNDLDSDRNFPYTKHLRRNVVRNPHVEFQLQGVLPVLREVNAMVAANRITTPIGRRPGRTVYFALSCLTLCVAGKLLAPATASDEMVRQWTLVDADCDYQVVQHVWDESGAAGQPSEQIRIAAGPGTYVHARRSVEPALVIDDLELGLWVRASRPGIQLFARVVLPAAVDPETGRALEVMVPGEVYRIQGRWQRLMLTKMLLPLRRQLRVLRARTRQHVPGKGAYVAGFVVNVYGGPGTTHVSLGQLERQGAVVPLTLQHNDGTQHVVPAEYSTESPAAVVRPERRGNRIVVGGQPFFPRIMEHRGEALSLEASQLQYQSLFQGEAQGELKEQAPYLVELKEDNSFTRQLFTGPEGVNGLWDKELGIYIRSRAPFADIRKHFRKFTRVQDENGNWFLFRFWDSKVSRFYLENIDAQRSYGKLRYIFSDIICKWVTCEIGTNTIFGLGKTEGSIDKAFQLNQNDYSIFSDFSWKKYLDKLLRILRSEHSDLYSLSTNDEIVEIAEQARQQNFRTEIAAYNYVRSCLTAYQLKLNFQTMLTQTAGGSPTEHARRLWHVVCNNKNEGQHNA